MSLRIAYRLFTRVPRVARDNVSRGLATYSCSHWSNLQAIRTPAVRPRPTFGVPVPSDRCTRVYSTAPTNAQQQTTFQDPERSDIYYHLVHPPNPLSTDYAAFAVSILPTPPPNSDSATILGWLPAQTLTDNAGNSEAGLSDFRENGAFRALLHDAIRAGLREDVDDVQINGATQLREGWMHINDMRNVPALGRIGDPDDIIGSVRVEDGKILAETYEPMPAYRLCTADGVVQLTEGLAAKLRKVLGERARAENESRN